MNKMPKSKKKAKIKRGKRRWLVIIYKNKNIQSFFMLKYMFLFLTFKIK